MKLVVICQFQEWKTNRWANKGGETFVVENLTFNQQMMIKKFGIPYLTNLLEWGNNQDTPKADDLCGKQFIKFWTITEDDDNSLWEEWETPWKLAYSPKHKAWTANRFVPAEYWWATAPSGNEYQGKYEGYILAPEGWRVEGSYKEHYVEKVAA